MCSIITFCAIAFQMLLLALTYSRGGYVAIFATLCFMWYLNKSKLFPVCLVMLSAMIIFISNGIERVGSITKTSDGSILHRFLLWEGGTGIITNNFISGVHPESPGKQYTAWYQPLWLDERYALLINDYLTIAAFYGIFALFGYLSIILFLTWSGIKIHNQTKKLFLSCLIGAVVAYSISALFSSFYYDWNIYWLFCSLLTLLLTVILFNVISKKIKITKFDIAIPLTLAASICIVILILGFITNANLPYTFKKIYLQDKKIEINKAYPKNMDIKANIIYLFNPKNRTLKEEIRFTVRPLLLQGFAVTAAGVDSGLDGLNAAKQLINYSFANLDNDKPVFILGHGDGAKHGLIVAANTRIPKLNGLVALGMPASWPWDEISPIAHVAKLKVPLLLIHGENDKTYSINESYLLKKFCDKNKLSVRMQTVANTGHDFANTRNRVFALIKNFIKTNK